MMNHPSTATEPAYDLKIKPGENIFLALGFPPDEAEALMAESDRCIRAEIALKADLACAINSWICEQQLTHESAANQLGMGLSDIRKLVRLRLNDFSISDMFQMAFKTGKQVTVSVR